MMMHWVSTHTQSRIQRHEIHRKDEKDEKSILLYYTTEREEKKLVIIQEGVDCKYYLIHV